MSKNCTGLRCPQQAGTVDPASCKAFETCEYRTRQDPFISMIEDEFPMIHAHIMNPPSEMKNALGLSFLVGLGRAVELANLYDKEGREGLEKMEARLKAEKDNIHGGCNEDSCPIIFPDDAEKENNEHD